MEMVWKIFTFVLHVGHTTHIFVPSANFRKLLVSGLHLFTVVVVVPVTSYLQDCSRLHFISSCIDGTDGCPQV